MYMYAFVNVWIKCVAPEVKNRLRTKSKASNRTSGIRLKTYFRLTRANLENALLVEIKKLQSADGRKRMLKLRMICTTCVAEQQQCGVNCFHEATCKISTGDVL